MSNDTPAISCLPDGPYLLKNDESSTVALCVQKSDGEEVTPVSGVALCRCGDSKNKPYCDGSHRNNGFSLKFLSLYPCNFVQSRCKSTACWAPEWFVDAIV
jgi:CDGSH-type Zn-finger protein